MKPKNGSGDGGDGSGSGSCVRGGVNYYEQLSIYVSTSDTGAHAACGGAGTRARES